MTLKDIFVFAMQDHSCEAVVISCIDFRFQKFIHKWLEENLKDKAYDYVGFAGSTKDLDIVMHQIDVSVKLHHIKEAYLIHHEDCGAYGKMGTRKRHIQDLKKAKEKILSKYPKLQTRTLYARLNGSFEQIA